MNTNGYIFIDAEYCYTCAAREGMIPSYKTIFEMLDLKFPDSVKILYHVGEPIRKKSLVDFTTKLGATYNIIIDYPHISKTQVIGSNIAIDTMKYLQSIKKQDTPFVFLTGDDYMIPIIDELIKCGITCCIYYFPVILAKPLMEIFYKKSDCLVSLSSRYFMYPHAQNSAAKLQEKK